MSNKVSSLIVLAAASIALTFGVAGCSKNQHPGHQRPESTSADRSVAGCSGYRQPGPNRRDPDYRRQRSAAASKSGAAAELSAACAGAAAFHQRSSGTAGSTEPELFL